MKATYYPPHSRVVVVLPGDPRTGQRGTVDSTRNVGGDMEHRVRFADGGNAAYFADELAGVKGTPGSEQG